MLSSPERIVIPVAAGDQAPEFTRTDHKGAAVSLSSYRGQSPVVLYFYPKNNTPACTAEACAFRDEFSDFENLGAVVIGVSSDSPESHRSFAQRNDLPFHLIADRDSQLRKLYGVPKTLGFLPGRTTYIIDTAGIVRAVFNSQLQPRRHVRQALAELQKLTPAL